VCGDLAPAGPPARREVASVPALGSAVPARLRLSPFAVNVNLRVPRAPGKRRRHAAAGAYPAASGRGRRARPRTRYVALTID